MPETNNPPASSLSATGSVPGREPNVPAPVAASLSESGAPIDDAVPSPNNTPAPTAAVAEPAAAPETPDLVLLSPAEIRVLGCLIEKQLTTPEYYPLTLNALNAAC